MRQVRTIVAAMSPVMVRDRFTEIALKVWFEEFDYPLDFIASPFDVEPHGRELWFRAMKGEYGSIEIVDPTTPLHNIELHGGVQ